MEIPTSPEAAFSSWLIDTASYGEKALTNMRAVFNGQPREHEGVNVKEFFRRLSGFEEASKGIASLNPEITKCVTELREIQLDGSNEVSDQAIALVRKLKNLSN